MGLSLRDSREGDAGLRRAVGLVWPRAAIQWCWVHKLHFHRIVYAADIDAARVAYTAFERTWAKCCPSAVSSLREGGDELLTFLAFPKVQWKTLRTTTTIERLHEEFRRRVKARCRAKTRRKIATVLRQHPALAAIERSFINAWDEPRIRDAVTRTGRQKLLIGGITPHVWLAFPAMSAVADGYDLYALLDASATWSDLLRLTAIEQMRQAGVTITSGSAAVVEMLHNNASLIAGEFYAALDLPATRYILQITQGGKSAWNWPDFDWMNRVEISQVALDTEERQAHVLQHIDLADAQSSRRLR